jgi:hypothetical protein
VLIDLDLNFAGPQDQLVRRMAATGSTSLLQPQKHDRTAAFWTATTAEITTTTSNPQGLRSHVVTITHVDQPRVLNTALWIFACNLQVKSNPQWQTFFSSLACYVAFMYRGQESRKATTLP